MSSPSLASAPPPPEAWGPLLRLARFAGRPIDRFLHVEAASGVVLLAAAAAALALANSPAAPWVARLWNTPVGVHVGGLAFERSLAWIVNDGLMTIFFFVVGLEIRREIAYGELSEWRRAALPAIAALGGVLVPAGIYLGLVGPGPMRAGWGVPMATDIAFAVGVLALLGRRVPAALRVLLLALAVIDDLLAIVVIALFYSGGISWAGLGVAAAGLAVMFAMRGAGVRPPAAYILPGVVAWAGTYAAGVHPTIAGVAIGLITPVRAWLGAEGLAAALRAQAERPGAPDREAIHRLEHARKEAQSPAERLIEGLHVWVAFGIMPLFALANAGVTLGGGALGGAPVTLGVTLGLLLGKPIGVVSASLLATKVGLAALPNGIGLRQLVVLGLVAGIGFTMALFVAQLAFADPALLDAAKLGVLIASGLAMVIGLAAGWFLLAPVTAPDVAKTADEAERSAER